MNIQPPQLGWASDHHDEEAVPTLDALFAEVLDVLMNDGVSAATAIQHFERASILAMQQYRDSASSLLHRAAHYIHAQRVASELESQAASWQLLQHLYCSGHHPAGDTMPGAADAGGLQTYREQAAGLVNESTDLRRCAQVVCWLESLAAQRLQNTPPARFAHHEGLWRETLLTSGGSGSKGFSNSSGSTTARELDPDAASRGKLKLAAGDLQGEERLAAHLWQLIRAGKVREACQLCCQAGQAWRCLSLAGGGIWGPLPLGEAAVEATQQIDEQAAADELSWQVEGGIAAAQVAWKWACYAAAEAAAKAAPGNRWEAAVYAAMCGHVMRMLPVCSSWEDEVWAYCRSWLDLQTDAELLEELESGDTDTQTYLMGSQQEDDLVSPDLLQGAVSQAASSGYSRSTDSSLLQEGLAVLAGQWPLQRLLAEGERSIVPRNFQELMRFVSNSNNSTVRSSSKDQQHILQLLVMSEDWQAVTLELTSAALSAAEQLQQMQQKQDQQQQQVDVAADTEMEYEGTDTSMFGGDQDASEISADSAAGALRFAAHWALCLRALGLLPDDRWLQDDDDEQGGLARLQNMLGKVVYQYSLLLAQQPSTLFLVPLYLCHLRQPQRESLLEILLVNATDVLDDEDCQMLYLQLLSATEGWHQRQERLRAVVVDEGKKPSPYWEVEAAEEGEPRQPSSCLFGDLRDEELRWLLQHVVSCGFSSSGHHLLQRCRQLRWLFYSFTGALAQQQQQQEEQAATGADASTAGSALTWQNIWGDALSSALDLASEMALNPKIGSSGLHTLLNDVLPAGFTQAVSQAAAAQLKYVSQQIEVQRQLQALSFWQTYTDLDSRYEQWREEWAAVLSGRAAGPVRTVAMLAQAADQGKALVTEMLHLAQQDLLRLPASEELAQHLAAMVAADPAAADVEVVAAGESMALPTSDRTEDRPTQLVIAVTLAGDNSELQTPFAQLQERDAHQLRSQLDDLLTELLRTTPDVSAEVRLPDHTSQESAEATLPEPAGTVIIQLTSYSSDVDHRSEADVDGSRLRRRMDRAWQDMVQVAAQLLSSNEAIPRLTLVHLSGTCSTRLALCRRRTTSKLLRRSGKVLLALARSGHPSSEFDLLIDAAGDGASREGPQLLELLTPADAGKLLVCIEQTIEEGGLLGEGVEGDVVLEAQAVVHRYTQPGSEAVLQ